MLHPVPWEIQTERGTAVKKAATRREFELVSTRHECWFSLIDEDEDGGKKSRESSRFTGEVWCLM